MRVKEPWSRALALSGKVNVMVDPDTDNGKEESMIAEPETMPERANVIGPLSTSAQTSLMFESCQL